MTLKVLVVDDTILFRRLLSEAISAIDGAEVVGTAANGRVALTRMHELKPDLVTLDIEMPGMDGLQVLDEMKKEKLSCGVIVVSALTQRGGKLTISALEKGAFDFVTKPAAASIDESRQLLIKSLSPLVGAFRRKHEIRSLLSTSAKTPAPSAPVVEKTGGKPVSPEESAKIETRPTPIVSSGKPRMVLIGVSTGGPNALNQMLPMLPASIGAPIFIVQHMPPLFTKPLADGLNDRCRLKVQEAEHGETARNDHIYIAPGGRHLALKSVGNGRIQLEITDDPPENNCRPAVDYLFRSAAVNFPGQAMSVILTGMGSDGMLGVKQLKQHGCFSIAQDEASCVVYGMPKAVVDAGLADLVLPLDAIAAKISSTLRGGLS